MKRLINLTSDLIKELLCGLTFLFLTAALRELARLHIAKHAFYLSVFIYSFIYLFCLFWSVRSLRWCLFTGIAPKRFDPQTLPRSCIGLHKLSFRDRRTNLENSASTILLICLFIYLLGGRGEILYFRIYILRRMICPRRDTADLQEEEEPSMHCKLSWQTSPTLSQLAFPGEGDPNFPWEKSQWDNAVVRSK